MIAFNPIQWISAIIRMIFSFIHLEQGPCRYNKSQPNDPVINPHKSWWLTKIDIVYHGLHWSVCGGRYRGLNIKTCLLISQIIWLDWRFPSFSHSIFQCFWSTINIFRLTSREKNKNNIQKTSKNNKKQPLTEITPLVNADSGGVTSRKEYPGWIGSK